MRLCKVALCSVNTTVGAFSQNADRAVLLARQMAAESVTLGIFQEQLVGGYPPEDLVHWQGFLDGQWEELLRFARSTAALPTAFVLGVGVAHEGSRFNCAAVVAGGRVRGLVPKEKLPTYEVFYEGRTSARGYPGMASAYKGVPLGDYLFEFDFGVLAVEVCEDLWSSDGPMKRRAYSGAEVVANLSASPYRLGFAQTRREMVSTRAADHQCTVCYSNAVGGNDGLIFDGGAFVSQNGKPLLESLRFKEGYEQITVDLDRTLRLRAENTTWRSDQGDYLSKHPSVPKVGILDFQTRREGLSFPLPPHRSFFLPVEEKLPTVREAFCEEILDALALGVGDYFEKTRAFKVIGVSLSGGRDSMLSLLIAHRYAQKARPSDPGSLLRAFYQPSRFSSAETLAAAETLCRELSVPLEVVSIDDAFERELAAVKELLKGTEVNALTKQNIQARLRAQRMWNWSNSASGLFLQTGNMSEKAVGYTTIGGDLMGALAVIANVPKTVVLYLLDYLYEKHRYEGIRLVGLKPAGPELALNQEGEKELMPFPVLDACFHLFAGEKMLPRDVLAVVGQMFPDIPPEIAKGYVEKFTRMFLQSIYKWVQSPLSLHIGQLDLDRERALQLPVVTCPDWTLD